MTVVWRSYSFLSFIIHNSSILLLLFKKSVRLPHLEKAIQQTEAPFRLPVERSLASDSASPSATSRGGLVCWCCRITPHWLGCLHLTWSCDAQLLQCCQHLALRLRSNQHEIPASKISMENAPSGISQPGIMQCRDSASPDVKLSDPPKSPVCFLMLLNLDQ